MLGNCAEIGRLRQVHGFGIIFGCLGLKQFTDGLGRHQQLMEPVISVRVFKQFNEVHYGTRLPSNWKSSNGG